MVSSVALPILTAWQSASDPSRMAGRLGHKILVKHPSNIIRALGRKRTERQPRLFRGLAPCPLVAGVKLLHWVLPEAGAIFDLALNLIACVGDRIQLAVGAALGLERPLEQMQKHAVQLAFDRTALALA